MARGPLLVFAPLLALVAACRPPESEPETPIVPVVVQRAQLSDYKPTASITGEVQARNQTALAFRVGGRVVERSVDVGDRVAEGDVLARLDPREQQADLAATEAGVEAAQAQLDQANSEFARQDALYRQGLTTRGVFEQAQEAVRTAQASLDAAQAQQATSADTLSYTQLRATAPGIVTARDIEVGQVVQAAETAFSVAEDGPRDAVFHVYERILFVRPETDHVALSLATDPSVSTTGTIREISPAVDATTGTVRVKVGIDNVPDRMNLGSAVVGQALLPGTRGVIVPWSALASDAGRPAVWIVDTDRGTTQLRPVRIEAYETGRIILAGGVEPGEAVVVDGTKFLRPDEKVSVIEEAGS
ncbi:efflux RND transporter periplasmic adaptor subunit [Aureimonas altamirensis]|uniref:efflux RND transporter periplasmic adaptor subunit n=1 Tax=Aureimonas altamirensis TaxID=370622 RepID=UPI002036C27C|nr:efflux RND transporter periplasmic adaptor subunit [Aureimonas altamirensis]MCM2504955.1 efflux RND transporter periplasmic adaptor subunit [Aureimonas altamirensis]